MEDNIRLSDIEQSRRDFLKKSAIAGAAAWSAPAILSLPGGQAWGQQYRCPCAGCNAAALGLSALGLQFANVEEGCKCLAEVNANLGTIGGAAADVVCGQADDQACAAKALVTGLEVRLTSTAVLEVGVLGTCVHCGTGDAYIADVFLVTTVLGVTTRTAVTVEAGCNQPIDLSALGITGVTIVFNEQTCNNGVLTVTGLRVTITGVAEVIAAQAKAGAAGCACQTCAEATCTPPTSQLCPTS